ncbi:hypothetical protein [Kitasatospora terrestris]|uniref:Gram-positive cocci surface proteins LPxTG domain-containing protein n=1 Tax=Kitasatospora terrestris TaxID=258051 RepID=A0ABP9DSY8_9ACTN
MRTLRARTLALPTAVAALALSAAAVPAHADDIKLSLSAPGSVQIPGKPVTKQEWDENLHLRIGRTGNTDVKNVKVVFDTKDLAGIAALSVDRCAVQGTVTTCDQPDLRFDSINISQHPFLNAVDGVKPGTSGVLHIKVTASGATEATADVRVDVGGPDFKAKDLAPITDAKVGGAVTPAIVFANRGGTASRKIVVEVSAVSALEVRQWPSNCEYAQEPDGSYEGRSWPGALDGVCVIDTPVAPGEVFKLSPLTFTVGATAEYDFADISVYPTEDSEVSAIPLWRKNLKLTRGTGPAMTATKTTDAALLTEERHPYDMRVEQEVRTDNPADFSALGAWAPAPGGRTGTLTVGERNDGPASIYDRSGGEAAPSVRVVFPDGVSVTKTPTGCSAVTWEDGQQVAKPNKYDCGGPWWVPSGFQGTYAFELAVAAPESAPAATVSLQNTESKYGTGHASAVMSWDHNAANDLVKVALGTSASGSIPTAKPKPTPTSTGPTSAPVVSLPTATPSAQRSTGAPSSAPAGGSASHTGGNLASTGASGIGPMVGGGIAAIALGGGVIALVARRRKAGAHQ